MNKIYLPKNVNKTIDILHKNHFKAYVVGGYIRDKLLGIETDDIDITTDATPHEILKLFSNDYKTIPTGLKYGTITVIIENVHIEITTFRSEKNYFDNRHPKDITYEKSLEKDLSRRDFTINQIAYNEDEGFIDIYDGINDLKNGIIRAIGDPNKRFEEDSLRMLRAIRFASKYNFNIEKNTFNSIKKLSPLIKNIAYERINIEFTKMLLTEKPSRSINLLHKSNLLKCLLPEIEKMYGYDQKNPYHQYDLYTHTLKTLDYAKPILELRLAALFHDTGKIDTRFFDDGGIAHYYGHEKVSVEIAKKALKRLKYSNKVINLTLKLIEKHQINPTQIKDKGIRKLINYIGIENIHLLANLQYADSSATCIKDNLLFTNKVNSILKREAAFSKKDLKISGYDIMNFGIEGKNIGKALDDLMELVLENPENNTKKSLNLFIEKNLKKYIK